MKHFDYLTPEKKELFYILPQEINKYSPKNLLSKALGGTLYVPITKDNIEKIVLKEKFKNISSLVIDLEDSISNDLKMLDTFNLKLKNIIKNLEINQNDNLPFIFIRPKNKKHLQDIIQLFENENVDFTKVLTGVVCPKFSSNNALEYISIIKEINKKYGVFYLMPILESKEIIYKENRYKELDFLYKVLKENKDLILNIRIGGTDFSGLYGLRRNIDTTIYDIKVVNDCISDILNYFNRSEDDFVVSGVVWEYFDVKENNRLFKPQLRESIFENHKKERKNIISNAIDGLLKETLIDKTNGIIGKTLIHPSHIHYVNVLQIVSFEEYTDALSILENKESGVIKSIHNNKMNEVNPHYNWAKRIIEKAYIYGVLKNDKNHVELFFD